MLFVLAVPTELDDVRKLGEVKLVEDPRDLLDLPRGEHTLIRTPAGMQRQDATDVTRVATERWMSIIDHK